MKHERTRLCLFTGVNFVVGIIVGIILFYGQQKSDASVFTGEYGYNKALELMDFFHVSWLNFLWLFAIFIAYNILPFAPMHPVILLRGCMSSFTLMYILSYVGIKEAVACILPQCFSVLPLLMFFSVQTAVKYREKHEKGEYAFSLKRSEVFLLLFLSLLAGGAEIVIFRFLTMCLG